jgi:hypothetical protein
MVDKSQEVTTTGIKAASLLAESLLGQAEVLNPTLVAKARAQVARGGRLEIAFVFGDAVTVELAVRDDYEKRLVIGSTECQPVRLS